MAEATIDSIKIEISASSDAAAENIKKLSEALKELKTSTSGGVRGLNTIKKQLDGLKTALSGADNSGTKLSEIARGLKALSEVQKSSGLSSTINALKKLPDISSQLSRMDMDKFAQSIKKATAALSPLAAEMEKVSKGFAAFPIRIQKIIQSNSGLTASNKKAADSFNSVGKFSLKSIANLTLFGFGINAVADVLSGFITNINAYVENMNLFSVSMGEYYSEAMEYAELVQSKLGIDISEWTRNQGIFMSMAKGFGLANDQAYNLSKGLTELSYDISSFFNISLDAVGDGAFAKVQSGISGELEPLRRLGYALDEATLQQVAYDHGVNQSIRTMTQAQKAIIRYTAIVEQSARMGVIGDMAKTLESPANALRILHMEFKSLSRAIGSIFIPALVKIIPVVQAVVEVLTEFAQALAKLFGFKMTDWSYSDWEGMGNAIDFGAGAADDMADGMSDAAAAAKKLKDYTLGIDELNIIKPDTGAGASGGSGAVGGAGWEKDWDLDSVWDESVLKNITRQVDELKEKVKDILPIIGLVSAGFLAWKLGPSLLGNLGLLASGLKKAYVNALMLKNALIGANKSSKLPALVGFVPAVYAPIEKLAKLLTSGVFKNGLGAAIMGAGGASLASCIAAIAATVSGIALLGAGLLDTVTKSKLFQHGIAGIIEIIGDFTKPIVNLVSSVFPDFEFGWKGINEALENATGGFIRVSDLAITLGGLLLFGPAGLAIEGIVLGIKAIGKATEDIIQPVDLFGDSISAATRDNVEPFIDAMDTLDSSIKTLEWGNIVITDSDVSNIQSQLSSITDTIVNSLSADKNEALKNLEPLRNALGADKFAEYSANVARGYDEQIKAVTDGEAEINKIIAAAAAENRALTAEEAAQISSIQASMKDTGIQYLSDTQTEANVILQNMKDNAADLTALQAAEIIKNAASARDESVAAAESLYNDTIFQLQKLKDAGLITDAAYGDMRRAAESNLEAAKSKAEETFEATKITAQTELGEMSKYIDLETGEMKSHWDLFCEGVVEDWAPIWENVKTLTSEGLESVRTNFNNAMDFIGNAWEEFCDWLPQFAAKKFNEITTNISNWYNEKVKPLFSLETWKQLGQDAIDGLVKGLGSLWDTGKDFAQLLLAGFRSKEGIDSHSPSKAFEESGLDSRQGYIIGFGDAKGIGVSLGSDIAKGISQSTPAITAAAQGIADSVQKVFNGISYDPGTNYMALINAAKESGDFEEAARLETIRNAKIDGEGLNWEKTFDFTGVTDQFQQVADQFSVQTDAMNTDYSEFVIQTKTSTESIKTDVLSSIETVDTALKTFITQTTNNFRTMAKQSNAQIQSIISALNAIPRNITTVHTIVTRSVSGGSGSTKGYASGGFPDTGELFLAREAGPELVGQIGKRTAVANNAQIVEGIRYGVADANAEQNALLQEQNELLRAILNKSGVYLDGKQLKKSVDKASRSSGANILIGGVV